MGNIKAGMQPIDASTGENNPMAIRRPRMETFGFLISVGYSEGLFGVNLHRCAK